jgi:hypothetical protein
MLPWNEVVAASIAELPTLHHTSQGSPLVTVTDEPADVVSVVAVLKTQGPEPRRISSPVSVKPPAEQ